MSNRQVPDPSFIDPAWTRTVQEQAGTDDLPTVRIEERRGPISGLITESEPASPAEPLPRIADALEALNDKFDVLLAHLGHGTLTGR